MLFAAEIAVGTVGGTVSFFHSCKLNQVGPARHFERAPVWQHNCGHAVKQTGGCSQQAAPVLVVDVHCRVHKETRVYFCTWSTRVGFGEALSAWRGD